MGHWLYNMFTAFRIDIQFSKMQNLELLVMSCLLSWLRTYHKDSYMAHRRGETLGQEGRYRRTPSSPMTASKTSTINTVNLNAVNGNPKESFSSMILTEEGTNANGAANNNNINNNNNNRNNLALGATGTLMNDNKFIPSSHIVEAWHKEM